MVQYQQRTIHGIILVSVSQFTRAVTGPRPFPLCQASFDCLCDLLPMQHLLHFIGRINNLRLGDSYQAGQDGIAVIGLVQYWKHTIKMWKFSQF